MTGLIAQARQITARPADALRFAMVTACALALIAAGQALPF
tara:strand:- start:23738 stop:23860 length:123 start_codon:yes stop_codon:yes gene_type:complete